VELKFGRAIPLRGLRYISSPLLVIRHYLIFVAKTRGFAHERLKGAIDDYAEEITGDAPRFMPSPQA
jgi:hypothetical protein